MWRFLAAMVIGTGGALAAAPPCAGDIEIGNAHIMRVERNGVLVMTDGRALHLEGIRMPTVPDRFPQTVMDAAFEALNALAKGQALTARAVFPKEDRYDRVRAQIFAPDGTWLQIELLKRGLARVDIAPDRGECFRDLYDAERQARKAGTGLWALPEFALRNPDQLAADAGTFQIVMGWVKGTAAVDGRVYLNFGDDWRTDFTVTISPDDLKTFKNMGVDPLLYKGRLIIVRGLVQMENGPMIAVGNPQQIELVQ